MDKDIVSMLEYVENAVHKKVYESGWEMYGDNIIYVSDVEGIVSDVINDIKGNL